MDKNAYDLIIIGSGISGMTAGIIAAKEGEKVLVLEQHSVPGGLMQTYKRAKMLFPTGVHRLGSLNPGEPLWYYFKYIDILDRLKLVKLDENGFEKIYFPGKTLYNLRQRRPGCGSRNSHSFGCSGLYPD